MPGSSMFYLAPRTGVPEMRRSLYGPMLRIAVNDPTNVPMARSSEFAVRAEHLGFAGVGMPDHPHTGRDVFIRLSMAARDTTRVMLFPSVSNPVSRDPKSLAALGCTLAELAPGRVRLMLASGDAAIDYVGKPPLPVAQMANAVLITRQALSTEVVPPIQVPVYVNASSPRMLEVAGSTADGVYPVVGVDPEVMREALASVKIGLQSTGREFDGFDVAYGLPVFMAESREEALQSALDYALANLLSRNRVFSRVLRARSPHLSEISKASDLTTDQARRLVAAMVVYGTPLQVAESVFALAEAQSAWHFIARVEMANKDGIEAIENFASALDAVSNC